MNAPVLSPVAPWARVLRPLSWGGALALLALPWVAMRFTDEVVWTGGDFALFGAMALQNSILIWASGHRTHHRHVDDVDLDPLPGDRGVLRGRRGLRHRNG